jgi:localization factor PodJL
LSQIALLCHEFGNEPLARLAYVEIMAGEAANTKSEAWLREGTRAAILNAARELFDRGGMETLSLGAVASETGFAPPTVYAYFTSKNDLLVATVANDLAGLARAMRDVYPFADPAPHEGETTCEIPAVETATEAEPIREAEVSPEPAQPDPMAEPQLFEKCSQQDQPFVTNLPMVGKKRRLLERREAGAQQSPQNEAPALMPHPERAQEEAAPEPQAPETQSSEPQPSSDDNELASLKESVNKLQARKVDAWLERRLRVFEKTLADVETRVANSEQASTRASALVEESSKAVAQRLEGAEKRLRDGLDSLAQRMELSEKRPRALPPDLRATINDLYARLETVEAGNSNATSVSELETKWAAPEEMSPAPQAALAEADKPITAAAETYLTAARRAASAAAQLAELEKPPRRFAAVSGKSLSRSNLMMLLCAMIVLTLVIYGLILRDYFDARPQGSEHAVATHHAAVVPPAAFGHVMALTNRGGIAGDLALGLDYLNGTHTAKNPVQAARWLRLAAQGGEPNAQYWYGTLFERGLGVKSDSDLAFQWYKSAAIQGNRRAIYNVAIAYAVGRGTARDMTLAADWFKRAADLGYVDAEYNLAVLYERGDGVPQSLSDAYKWYAIAAASGDGESKTRTGAIANQLAPDDLSAAQSAAASFKPEPINRAANLTPMLPARG